MARYKGSGGSTDHYTGPGSSWKQNKAVGVGQDYGKKVGAGNMGMGTPTPPATRPVAPAANRARPTLPAQASPTATAAVNKPPPTKMGTGQDRGRVKVGRGQDSAKEEKAEAKAEKKENRAIKDLQSAQKMEKSVGAGQRSPVPPAVRGMGSPPIPMSGPPMPPGAMPGGGIPPAGRSPGKLRRKAPPAFRRGR